MSGTLLPINEMFETIQGEATHAGRPSVFVRLQGCPVGCAWCDTRYTWELAAPAISMGEMLLKGHGETTQAPVSARDLIAQIEQYRSRHVVITGGEPCMHDLFPLTAGLLEAGRSVQIETSGTFPVRVHAGAWVTVSPKVAMPGGLDVLDEALARANEIKMPIGRTADLVALFALLGRGVVQEGVPVWLQPLSLSRKATDLCTAAAIANGYRLSLQTHALAGLR